MRRLMDHVDVQLVVPLNLEQHDLTIARKGLFRCEPADGRLHRSNIGGPCRREQRVLRRDRCPAGAVVFSDGRRLQSAASVS
jgi:hypothetical protein